ncbi:MAG: CHAD domain-containing protein [Nitriliruptoraceae bacterium]
MASVVFEAGGDARPTVASVLAGAKVELQPAVPLDRTRFDTLDGRLFEAGLRAELRTTDGRTQELVVVARTGAPAHLPLSGLLDPSRPLPIDRLPPGPLRSRLQQVAGDRAVVPQVRCVTQRSSGIAVDEHGAPTVTVHVDEAVSLLARPTDPVPPARGLPLLAVEVASLPGRETVAAELRRALGKALGPAGRRATANEGDVLELVAVRAGVHRDGWRGVVLPPLRRRDDAIDGIRTVLRSFADELERTWGPAADHVDDEALHAFRIAVRQTRSLLGQSRRVLPKDVRKAQAEAFRWLGTVTSPARDLDVYVAGWDQLVAPLRRSNAQALEPVLAHLAGQRAIAHGEVARALRSRTARELREGWRAWLDLPDIEVVGGRDAVRRLGAVTAERILDAHNRLLADGRRIDADTPAEQLHELRKDGKRLRYLLEGFGDLGGHKQAKRVIGQLKALQDNLGAHQDAEVQATRLRRALEELDEGPDGGDGPGLDPETRAAGDRLVRILGERQAAERARFADVFADYDRRKARTRLTELTDRMAR